MQELDYYGDMRVRLWKHNNGTFYALWMQDGKQRQKSLKTKDKALALKLHAHFRRQLIAGKIKDITLGPRVSFFSFIEEALCHYETVAEKSTYQLYSVALDRARRSWGDLHLSQISSRHFDQFVSDLIHDGLKTATVNKYLRHIKAAINLAYRWEYIKNPPKFPKELKERKQLRYLTGKELLKIVQHIDDPEIADFCLFSAFTGLRVSEIIRLHWKDIDTPKGYIRVSSEQKSKEDDRIPVNKFARGILDKKKRDIGPIFRFKSRHWPSRKFKEAAVKAGLPCARFHDLRHSFATTLVKSGVDIRTIQKLMRHADLDSTMVYAKVQDDHLSQASNKLDYDFY